jgi:mycofactocin precursor
MTARTLTEETDSLPQETAAAPEVVAPATARDELVEDDLLVEDVSIDGMCGVY